MNNILTHMNKFNPYIQEQYFSNRNKFTKKGHVPYFQEQYFIILELVYDGKEHDLIII